MHAPKREETGWTLAEALARLEGPHRYRHQNPSRFWTSVGLRRGERVLDVGAGTGFFATAAARRVGWKGRVYAADISEELVEYLWKRKIDRKLFRLFLLLSTADRLPVPQIR